MSFSRWLIGISVLLLASACAVAAQLPAPTPERVAEYESQVAKSILELQQFRRSSSIEVPSRAGKRQGKVTLVELNPYINTWMLFTLDPGTGAKADTYHLENTAPDEQRIHLDADFWQGVVISEKGQEVRCELWTDSAASPLGQARATGLPYAPLCDGRLLLRNPVSGRRTRLEQATDFLRDSIWGGESIVGFVRDSFFVDAFLESGTTAESMPCPSSTSDSPAEAIVNSAYKGLTVIPENLGIDVAAAPGRKLSMGCWYPVKNLEGVFVSAIQPKAVSLDILSSYQARVANLDSVESSALDYLVAFDLDQFDLVFEMGTDHPRLDWSGRPGPAVRDNRLPGPDGVAGAAPVVNTGMVSPALANRTVAVFTGGFKRTHGAFRYGSLSQINHGSHYGFIANGTVFSKLQPYLSTLYVLDDGTVDIKTWDEADAGLLGSIRHARQNGVPLVDADPETGKPAPGTLVNRWGPGNWSGSAEGKLRTLRAGACILETPSSRFLVYGYFSTATPSAMARVFQAYGCRAAMLLDMNALEHTYMALYTRKDGQMAVQHLITGMTEVDKAVGKQLIPRFMGFPDNRDFFYLTRREASE